MGACEITLVSILVVILLVWYFKSVYQPSCQRARAATDAEGEDQAYDEDMYPPTYEGDAEPAANDDGWPGETAPISSHLTTTVSPLEPFGDPDADDLSGSGAPKRASTGAFPGVFDGSDSVTHDMGDVTSMKTRRSRYAIAMGAERQWQMQNALKTVEERGFGNRNSRGRTVGVQALFEAYSGATMPKPRASPNGRAGLYMVEGTPEAERLRHQAVSPVDNNPAYVLTGSPRHSST